MRRKALFVSATVLLITPVSGCDDTRRDWDVCHSEPCKEGYFCNAEQRCEPIEASVDSGRAEAGDAAADGDAVADVVADTPADAGDEVFLDGNDQDAPPDASSTGDGSAD